MTSLARFLLYSPSGMGVSAKFIGYIVILVLLAGVTSCGGGGPGGGAGGVGVQIGGPSSTIGEGGQQASPTGGSGTPVAVELPQLEEAADLLYVTSVVIDDGLSGGGVADGSLSSGKSQILGKAVAASTQAQAAVKIGMSGDPFGADSSLAACETTTQFRDVLKSASATDYTLCVLQSNIAPAMASDAIDIYDGLDHDVRLEITEDGEISTADVRFKLVRNGKGIRLFELFACTDGQQVHYNRQTIENAIVSIFGKDISADYRSTVTLRGQLNSLLQFGKKVVETAGHGKGGGGLQSQKETLTQYPGRAKLDGFRHIDKDHEFESTRLFSAFELGYTGSPFYPDPTEYFIGSGAGHLIADYEDSLHRESDHQDILECWNGAGEVDPSACGPFMDVVRGQEEPRAIERVAISDFEDDEAVDCSSLQPEFTVPLNMDENDCNRFAVPHDDIECLKN